jgi:hypothetical protein
LSELHCDVSRFPKRRSPLRLFVWNVLNGAKRLSVLNDLNRPQSYFEPLNFELLNRVALQRLERLDRVSSDVSAAQAYFYFFSTLSTIRH